MISFALCTALVTLYYLDLISVKKIKKYAFAAASVVMAAAIFASGTWGNSAVLVGCLVLCSFVIQTALYKNKISSALFSSVSVGVLSGLSIEGVKALLCGIFSINSSEYNQSRFITFMGSLAAALIYSALIFIISRFHHKSEPCGKISFPLLIAPIASVLVIIANINAAQKYAAAVGCAMLVIGNIVTIYVHEFAVRSITEAERIKTENKRLRDREEYYTLLSVQNEESRIIRHDIKKHLAMISAFGDDKHLTEYIDGLVGDYGLTAPVDYCKNATLNLITHRFFEKCKAENIRFDVNIREADIDFMTAPDITALFDNMLENAFEAAVLSDERYIDFSIVKRNTNFRIIKLVNSCTQRDNDSLLVSRKKGGGHGIGTKSIRRIVKKYDGEVSMRFNEDDGTFECGIIFNCILK